MRGQFGSNWVCDDGVVFKSVFDDAAAGSSVTDARRTESGTSIAQSIEMVDMSMLASVDTDAAAHSDPVLLHPRCGMQFSRHGSLMYTHQPFGYGDQ